MAYAIYRPVTCFSMHYLPTAFGLRTGILFAKLDCILFKMEFYFLNSESLACVGGVPAEILIV